MLGERLLFVAYGTMLIVAGVVVCREVYRTGHLPPGGPAGALLSLLLVGAGSLATSMGIVMVGAGVLASL